MQKNKFNSIVNFIYLLIEFKLNNIIKLNYNKKLF
jgi:hypothetical protein